MMSKEKILKGVDEQIKNLYCGMVDDDLDPTISKDVVKQGQERMEELKKVRELLEKLLI